MRGSPEDRRRREGAAGEFRQGCTNGMRHQIERRSFLQIQDMEKKGVAMFPRLGNGRKLIGVDGAEAAGGEQPGKALIPVSR